MKTHKKIRLSLVLSLLLCLLVSGVFIAVNHAEQADASKVSTANLRLIFTTDLHGQLGTYDYQSGKNYNKGSLAKAYTLIKEARAEVGKKNTMTFDIGDVLYDFSTDQIFQNGQDEIQPIFQAMSQVGYDAITVGNHDLDYGLEYLKNQYEGAGLSDLVISSNIKNAVTKQSEWNERKIITKTIKNDEGRNVEVKVGILGVVIPKLSTKTEDYTGTLVSEDIVQNVTHESAALKKEGADIVIVLSHSGMGEETPVEEAKNVSYALTKIPDVDVVLCGHEHNAYPSDSDAVKTYYELPNTDAATGFMNGKVILMSKDRGQSIGVADLTLSFDSQGSVSIKKANEEIRFVTTDTPAVKKFDGKKGMGQWHTRLKKIVKQDEVLVSLAEGSNVNNFFGMIEDTSAMQLLNDSKISYCMSYLQSNYGDTYSSYPVVAASRYVSYGEIDGTDYIYFEDEIKESDLAKLSSYNKYVDIYKVTGAQLREWMEWSASAYLKTGDTAAFSDSIMNRLIEANDYQSALTTEGLNYWSCFYQFDGVEYTIDPSQEPRYDISGIKISDSHRIVSLTHNGSPVRDTDEFVLIADRQSQIKEATSGLDTQRLVKLKYVSVQKILEDYLRKLNTGNPISLEADHNWVVLYDMEKEYLLKSGEESFFESQNLGLTRVAYQNYYNYYKGSLANLYRGIGTKDTYAPGLVISSTNEEITNRNINVSVQANDLSGVRRVLFYKGDLEKDDMLWDYMSEQGKYNASNGFIVSENGIYTVMAEDFLGNRVIKKIKVDNIDSGILQKPKVKAYNNRSKTIRGTADPYVTVVIEADGVTYETSAEADGSFSYALPYQNAGTQVSVKVVDGLGRSSKENIVTVGRTGPNLPKFAKIENRDEQITGNVNDSNVTVIAIVNGSKVYLADQAAKERWEDCDNYDSNKTVVYTRVKIKENGKFTMQIPVLKGRTKVNLYTIDAIGRLSRITKKKVKVVAPNQPKLYDVTDVEKMIYGYVPAAKKFKGTEYSIKVQVDGEEYEGVSDTNGYFAVELYDVPETGAEISVCAAAKDSEGIMMESAYCDTTVQSAESFIAKKSSIEIDGMTDKTDEITGISKEKGAFLQICYKNKNYEVETDEDGYYQLDLANRIAADTPVYVISRYDDGEMDEVAMTYVEKGLAQKPELSKDEITNNTTKLKISTDEACEIVVSYDNQRLVTSEYEYDEITGSYVYTVKTPRIASKTEVKIYARNRAGNSKKTKFKVVELSPDTPKLDESITEDTKEITGTVHILQPEITDDDREEDAESGEETGQQEEPDTPTVESTGTKVVFRIGGKEYQAVVKDDGTFNLKIKKSMKLKAGSKVTYWAENDAGGKGISKTVVVKKSKDDSKKEETSGDGEVAVGSIR